MSFSVTYLGMSVLLIIVKLAYFYFTKFYYSNSNMFQAMKLLPHSVREGLMTLLIHPFQKACLPFPNHILEEVNMRLPVIAYQRNEDLLINIKVPEL